MKVFSNKYFQKGYWFYFICFMVLNFLDLLINTQNGDIRKVVANSTGIVLMVLVSRKYKLRDFSGLIFYIWTAVMGVVIAIAIAKGEYFIFGIFKWAFIVALLNVWGVVIYCNLFLQRFIKSETSISELLNAETVKKFIKQQGMSIVCFVMVLFMTFSEQIRIWPIWYFCIFTFFYHTRYSKAEMTVLMNAMVDGIIFTFFIIQIYAFGFRPYDALRYGGAYGNSNMMALYYLVVYMMILFKLHFLHKAKASKWWKGFYFLGAGALLSFQLLTVGRTAMLVSFVITFLYGILILIKNWKQTWMTAIGKGASLVLCMVITFPLVFTSVRWLPTILHHPIWYDGEYGVNRVHSFDPADSEKYTEIEEFLENFFGRISGTIQISASIRNPFVLYVQAAEYETIDEIGLEWMDKSARARLSIYKAYWDDLNWTGHSTLGGQYMIDGTGYIAPHAHNVWLQVAYFYGIPAGILFLFLTIVLLITNYRKLKEETNQMYSIIPFFVCFVFLGFGALELDWYLGQLIMFLFLFVQHPDLGKHRVLGENLEDIGNSL